MASYVRDIERADSLPSIHERAAGLLEHGGRRGISAVDDVYATDRHVRFSSAADPLFYPRPPSPTYNARRQMAELQDQVRLFRDELAKKDHLITQLSSVEATPRPFKGVDTTRIEEIYAQDRLTSAATARSEIAALSVRNESLQSQLRESQAQLDQREAKLRDLTLQLETARELDAKNAALTTSLRQRVMELDAEAGNIEGAASRSEFAVQSLQQQLKGAQERILELESRVRTHLEEKEEAAQKMEMTERKLVEIVGHFTSIMHLEDLTHGSASATEKICAELTNIVQENAMLKGKLLTMKEYMTNAELETKASRETIMRLVSEAEREQRVQSKYTLELDNLRVERDNAVAKARELELEARTLQERLDSCQRAWNATRTELETRENRLSVLDREARDTIHAARNAEEQLKIFKDQLANLLTDSYHTVEPFEEHIRDKIKQLQLGNRDKTAHIDMLEKKLASVVDQLTAEKNMQRDGSYRAVQAEKSLLELEERVRRAEHELAAGDAMRDTLRVDKERYFHFLEQVSLALKMDKISADLGLDMVIEAILARADQLARLEQDALVDRQTHIHNLQRKVKSLKEQLESKDLHMDLLRKKVTSLEERLLGRSELEKERDGELLKSRKLVKLVDRYKRELNECRLEVRDLKARLLESSDIRSRTLEQEREIENLEVKVGQLEHVRQKQADRIAGLKDVVDVSSKDFQDKRSKAQHTVHSLTRELRTTKMALDEITKRERQLLDLRAVLARMLGLDVNTLAVPDYEIISRLEKLILAQSTNSATIATLDHALAGASDAFRAGYAEASGVIPRARSPVRQSRSRVRSRSMSPTRKRDTRAY